MSYFDVLLAKKLAEQSGGGGTMKIEVNYDFDEGLLGIEATYNELSEAVESGKIVWLSYTTEDGITIIEYLTNLSKDKVINEYWATFAGWDNDEGAPLTNEFYNSDPDSDMLAD